MSPLQQLGERLRWSWGVVCHLNAVCNSSELRKSHASQQPEVVRLMNRFGQSRVIYKSLCQLKDLPLHILNSTQRRIIEAELLSMNQRGVGLTGSRKKEFNSDSERLAELSTIFCNNVLDATKEWSLLLTKKSQVK